MDTKTGHSELRERVAQLRLISSKKDPVLFFNELLIYVDWLLNEPLFAGAIDQLEKDATKYIEEVNLTKIKLNKSTADVWANIKPKLSKKVKVYLNGQYRVNHPTSSMEFPEFELVAHVDRLLISDDSELLWRNVYFIVWELANSPYHEIVTPYMSYSVHSRILQICGDAQETMVLLDRITDKYKSRLENTLSGAWALIKYPRILAKEPDSQWQFTEWAKAYKIDNYMVYIDRIANFIIDQIYTQNQMLSRRHRDIRIIRYFEEDGNGKVELTNKQIVRIGRLKTRTVLLLSLLSNNNFEGTYTIGRVFEAIRKDIDKDKMELLKTDAQHYVIRNVVRSIQRISELNNCFGMRRNGNNVTFH